jgi:hypothetical protein
MRAQCIQECWHGPKCIKYTPDGGKDGDGYYDIEPLDPIAQYFEFPVGTVKYCKKLGKKKEGIANEETTIKVAGEDPPVEAPDADIPTIKAQLKEKGIPFDNRFGKEKLLSLLNPEEE